LPRLIISIGRRSVPIALALKSVAKAFALHIQNPKVPKQRFDLIAAPLHDGYTGKNVINTFGAVHSVTPKRLAEAAQSFAAKIDHLPRPRIRYCNPRVAWRWLQASSRYCRRRSVSTSCIPDKSTERPMIPGWLMRLSP